MTTLTRNPFVVFAFAFVVMWASAWTGTQLWRIRPAADNAEREDLGTIQSAALTLLALLIGFSFSMAVGRYDQRKSYGKRRHAIGTEYFRADLLQAADGARLRQLLKAYVDERVLFYTTADARNLEQINTACARPKSSGAESAIHNRRRKVAGAVVKLPPALGRNRRPCIAPRASRVGVASNISPLASTTTDPWRCLW